MTAIHFLYCPFPDLETARMAARALLEARLVACCNILPATESYYRWEGVLTQASEVVLLAKTAENALAAAKSALEALHPYDTPAILSFPAHANPSFSAWVATETAGAIFSD